MAEAPATNAVISALVGWIITGAVFFAVDVVARKNLATRWLRLLILGGFLLVTAFWVLIALQSAQPVRSSVPIRSEQQGHGKRATIP